MPPRDESYRDYEDEDFDRYEDDPRHDDFGERRYGPPPQRRSGVKRWLVVLAAIFVGLPLLCCGGLLFLSMVYKNFELSNGQHLGGSAMHVTFEYRIKQRSPFLKGDYKMVAETADGVRRERDLPTRFESPGRFVMNPIDAGPAEESKSPVKVWIEKDGKRDSNVLTIPIRTN